MRVSAMKANYGIGPLMKMVELLITKQKSHKCLVSVVYISSTFGTRQADVFVL